MSATMQCGNPEAHERHHYRRDERSLPMYCPGVKVPPGGWDDVGPVSTELPVEHELVQGELYVGPHMETGWYTVDSTGIEGISWTRYAPVARYEPPAPEVKEPQGLGAVVEVNGGNLVHIGDGYWLDDGGLKWRWSNLKHTKTVLSEGVEL